MSKHYKHRCGNRVHWNPGVHGGICHMLHILVDIVVHDMHILVGGLLANKDILFIGHWLKYQPYLFVYLFRTTISEFSVHKINDSTKVI